MKKVFATKIAALLVLLVGCAAEAPDENDEQQGDTSSAISEKEKNERAADQCSLTVKPGVVEYAPSYSDYGGICRTKAGTCRVAPQPICSVCLCGSVRGIISAQG